MAVARDQRVLRVPVGQAGCQGRLTNIICICEYKYLQIFSEGMKNAALLIPLRIGDVSSLFLFRY